ncbi:MAG TPA: FAD-binding oxidoreductase [Candidatus Binatus sp.]|nr:FAD-binding oxidoreductase [Candidatus Binatus sp.]
MTETADAIVVGAGVQGASLAFHLAERGVRVVIVEQHSVASGATGRSSGFVRMHYDLETEARLAWASHPYFRDWEHRVGAGDCGFVRTGFVQLVAPDLVASLRANVAMLQGIGVPTRVIGPDEVAELVPGADVSDVVAAAHEPESGYADPAGTAAGFVAAARQRGARLVRGARVASVLAEGGRVVGIETSEGRIAAPIVVDVAGAWAAELAATVGVDVPVQAWRHDTAFFGLPTGRAADFPVVIDEAHQMYFRPEGSEMMLVGLETGNEVGGSPDRPLTGIRPTSADEMIARICQRVPWMADGTFRTAYGGQDGITPDQRSILGPAGPAGFYLACGFSGTGFKTAPAVGACMAELILDGAARTVDISGYALTRFAEGRALEGEHPYGHLWR